MIPIQAVPGDDDDAATSKDNTIDLTGASYRSIDIECKEDTNRSGTRYV